MPGPQLLDGNYDPVIGGQVYDIVNHVFRALQGGTSGTDSNGTPYMTALMELLIKASADAQVAANVGLVAMGRYNGATVDRDRIANVFKPFNAQALTAQASNTPVSIWTPTTGKKFRLLGYWFSLTTAAGLVFHDLASQGGTGLLNVPSPIAAANGIVQSPPLGMGVLSAAANNQLWIDATTGTPSATGFVWGCEE